MDNPEIISLARQVRRNCDISDAHHAGRFSICGLALRLRDLFKWEKRLPPWVERDSAEVLAWIEAKEDGWEAVAENEYLPLRFMGKDFDAFDAEGINVVLAPHNLHYGAGYALSLKPSFFLAVVENSFRINGYPVWCLGRELARDLVTVPAMTQGDTVILRQEAAYIFLWDKLFYINKSGRFALDFALEQLRIADTDPAALRKHLPRIFSAVKEIYIHHELGEIQEAVFDRQRFREIIAAFPLSPVEFIARALKDFLADTGESGTLRYLIRNRHTAGLAFYVAFVDGLIKEFFPEIRSAFAPFTASKDWRLIERAVADGHRSARRKTRLLLDIYGEGVEKNDLKWAESEIQKRLLAGSAKPA